jgi:ribose/xylose/arabinose/galactoside ABC-type transport system permease subunit
MDPSITSGAARRTGPGALRGLLPHLVWEALLLLSAVGLAIALAVTNSRVFGQGSVVLWSQLAITGMFAAALALSFRTATPNLAVASVGTASGWVYVELVNGGSGSVVAWLVAVLTALAIGLVLAVIVGFSPLPAWAVSLVATGIILGVIRLGDNVNLQPLRDGVTGRGTFIAWTVLFVLGSVAAGVVFAVPAVRAATSRNRVDPGTEPPRLGARLVGALIGLAGSSLLGGIAGVLSVLRLQAAQQFDFSLALVLAAVLLGGVSVLGRRAGVLGVVLAVTALVFVQTLLALEGVSSGAQLLVISVLGLAGLGVNAVLEVIGRWADRPRPAALTAPPPPGSPPPGSPPGSPTGPSPASLPGSSPGSVPEPSPWGQPAPPPGSLPGTPPGPPPGSPPGPTPWGQPAQPS